jgi:RNA polymerase sigma factor (sigma-70 family)
VLTLFVLRVSLPSLPAFPEFSCKLARLPDGETAIASPELKKNWSLTEGAFQQLLGWLDEGVPSDGERYLEIRRRLVHYFDRRGCAAADDLADETLNRAARKLAELGQIANVAPAQYCYVLARFVFLEYIRRPGHKESEFDDSARPVGVATSISISHDSDSSVAEREQNLSQLNRCMLKLPPADQQLILDYYQGDKRAKIDKRSQLAARYGLTLNALSVRACRIRYKLEQCVKKSTSSNEVKISKPSYKSGS